VATEAKPFASLSSGLLARKGAARPAMRPQGFGQVGNGLEDLGWDDMGFEPPKAVEADRDPEHDAFGEDVVEHPRVHPTGLTPIHSPVHHQQAEIVDRLNDFVEPGDDEVDETAELYDPEGDPTVAPEADEVVAVEVKSPAPKQQAIAVAPMATPVPAGRRFSPPRAAAGSKGKAAFTLRLDKERHLKLRLACAVDGRSAQQLVTDALDQLLVRMPDLNGLAEKAKRRG
jgi:hypothetical protein